MTPRAAQVRFYVDADVLGLGKLLAGLRNVANPDVLDTDWIPQVATRGWLSITRGSTISQNRNEITAIRENQAKMVALNQRDAQTEWASSKSS